MTATSKAYKGVGMEGPIARWYAANTGKDMGRHERAVEEEVAGMNLGPVSRALTRYTLGTWLPKRAYTAEEFTRMAARTAFGSAEVRETPLGLGVTLRR